MDWKAPKSFRERQTNRFGRIAVRRGYATLQQVQTALAEQLADDVADGQHRRLDEILLAHGWITVEQVISVHNEMSLEKV